MLELTQIIDLYLELPVRRVLPNLFSRKPPAESVRDEVCSVLAKGASAVQKLAKFDAFVLGDRFTAADIAAVIHFPIVRMIGSRVLEVDPLGAIPGLTDYLARLEQRPTVQKIRADQAANLPDFLKHIQSH